VTGQRAVPWLFAPSAAPEEEVTDGSSGGEGVTISGAIVAGCPNRSPGRADSHLALSSSHVAPGDACGRAGGDLAPVVC